MELSGVRTLAIENRWLRATVLPDVGAKIYDLIYKPTSRNLLWHNPRIAPQSYPVEGIFDNYWCGGWDDCFPTCDACDYEGERYPSLGELRSLHWTVDSAGPLEATLSAYGPISPVHVTKTISLNEDSPILRVRHRIENLGPRPLDFIWGTHPALNVSEDSVLLIPARTGIVGEASTPLFGAPGQRYTWPRLDSAAGSLDMSRVQPRDMGAFCGHYATDLDAGWYAVEDSKTGAGFLVRFPKETCPVLWLWLTYGGYRGHYHVVLEPWTSMPVNLADAARAASSRRLEAGQTFEVEIEAAAYVRPDKPEDVLRRMENEEQA
jgi:hypothetical protein